MARFVAQARFIIGALALALIIAIAAPAGAQQPSAVNPTAASVKEQQLLNALGTGDAIHGRVTIPDRGDRKLAHPGRTAGSKSAQRLDADESDVVEQSAGYLVHAGAGGFREFELSNGHGSSGSALVSSGA